MTAPRMAKKGYFSPLREIKALNNYLSGIGRVPEGKGDGSIFNNIKMLINRTAPLRTVPFTSVWRRVVR
jgi:hypothetical protein